ncbi:Lrp/AsnC family transcriptional regulator [soil metagenome]
MDNMPTPRHRDRSLDGLDARLLDVLHTHPQIGVLGASRQLGVARGTIQSRLDAMVAGGVIATFAPTLEPKAMGYPVTAFTTLQIRQGTGPEPVITHLRAIPEVIEAHTITGDGDLMLRLVARGNEDLQRIVNLVLQHELVERSSTVIALSTKIDARTQPLVAATASDT